MSTLIRRSFNLLKYIEYKPLNSLCNYRSVVLHSNSHKMFCDSIQPVIQYIQIQNFSSNPPENHVINEELIGQEIRHRNESEYDFNQTRMESEDNSEMNVRTSDPNMARIQEFWVKNDISVHGKDAPLPVLDMEAYEWPQSIKQALVADGFNDPTPIQCQGWPIVLSGRDMVGVAQTGSGKTLCYVLPAFVKILTDGVKSGPKCLILAPTRELAQQIQAVVRRYRFANNVCLYGGASRMPQMQVLREHNPQIIIATPGRMIDFVECNAVDLKSVDYLVLDEADRMLDMGFEPQIRKIIDRIPRERQTVMWSATWPKEVKALAAQYMRDYIQINVGGTELSANKNIEQYVEVCEEFDKKRKLFELLTKIRADLRQNKTLIFAKTKQTVDYLTNEMQRNGWPAICIHGDKTQLMRDRVLNDFRSGRFPILVATDVAARGLDVDDIKVVVNFDYPNSGEDYVHRIGRTGRLDKKGIAYTFFSSGDAKQANELMELLRDSNQAISPQLMEMANISKNVSTGDKRRRYGTAGMASGYSGYQNKGYQSYGSSNYGRSYNNQYDGQQQQRRRPAYQSGYRPNYSDNSGQPSGAYGSNSGYNNNSGNPGSTYGSGRGSGPPFRGY